MDMGQRQPPPNADELARLGAEYKAALGTLMAQTPPDLRPALIAVERTRNAYWRALCREIAAEAAVEAIEALVGDAEKYP